MPENTTFARPRQSAALPVESITGKVALPRDQRLREVWLPAAPSTWGCGAAGCRTPGSGARASEQASPTGHSSLVAFPSRAPVARARLKAAPPKPGRTRLRPGRGHRALQGHAWNTPFARPRQSAALPVESITGKVALPRDQRLREVRLPAAPSTWGCGAAGCRTPGSGAKPSEQPSRGFRRCGFQPRRWMGDDGRTWIFSAGFPSPCNPRAGRPRPQHPAAFPSVFPHCPPAGRKLSRLSLFPPALHPPGRG